MESTFYGSAKTFFAYLILLCSSTEVVAQGREITGQVTSGDDNSPMIGVNVIVPGTTRGTVTDIDGNFFLQVDESVEELVFSFVGYRKDTVTIGNRTNLSVVLQPDVEQLEDIVVIGYGVQRKSDVTGAISKVKGEELAQQPVQTATQAVQGKMAGVRVISSGQPNSQPDIRVRGTGSLLAGVNPLYVVDGVLTDDIRNINTADIVSMEVLKDASAAIYGVRAANGVVIITTRQGEEGKPVVRYDGNVGFRQAANLVEMAGRSQYVSYLEDAAPGKVAADDSPPLTFPGTTDWYEEVLRNAFYMNHNLSVSGGTENHRYYFSGGYFDEEGIIVTNDFSRFTFRANNEVDVSDQLRFGSQLSFSRGSGRDVELGNVYRNIYRAAPVVKAEEGGRYGNTSAWGNVGNPLLGLEARNSRNTFDRLQGNISLDYNPVEWLTFHSAFNTDVRMNKIRTYFYEYENDTVTFLSAGGTQRRENSQLTLREERSISWVWNNTITAERTFGRHSATLLVGAVTENFNSTFLEGSRIDVPENQDLWFLDLGDPDNQSLNTSNGDRFTRQSFLGRITYNYAGKYLLTASLRADGSSKFSERWGYFPTVGLGWVLSDENFMQGEEWLERLKIRGSWGILGNDNIPTNSYITTANVNIPYFFDNNISLGTAIQDIKDADLKWEKTTQYDIGIEFEFLNSRLTGEIDYYNKETEDALIIVNIPAILGDPDNTYITNAASYRNRGWEFSLNWNDQISEDFTYSAGANITFNDNEITGLRGGQALLGGSVGQQSFVTRSDNGVPIGSFYVRDVIGIFQTPDDVSSYTNADGDLYQPGSQPGDFQYRDVDDDGDIDDDDKIYAGSYQPDFYFGVNLGVNFMNFDLSAVFVGNGGNEIYNGKKAYRFENTDNIEAEYAESRWTEENHSTTDPRLILSNTPASTYFIEKGSFVRLNNLTLGYTVPETAFDNVFVTSLRVFVTSQNLFTITDYSGFSPELPGGTLDTEGNGVLDAGIELNAYPTTRTFAFGVNATF